MQYTLFTSQFGNFNDYLDEAAVGPSGSTASIGIDATRGKLEGRTSDVAMTDATDLVLIPPTSKTIIPFSNRAIGMDERLAVVSWGGRLYRSHKGFSPFANTDIDCVQYTTDLEPGTITTQPQWDCLGLFTPNTTPGYSVASGGSLPIDSYKYAVTFYNALGHESAPTEGVAAVSTTSGNQTINLTGISIKYGDITTNGTTSATTTSTALRRGMRISGQYIAANTYITSVDYTVSPFVVTLSQAATGSGVGSFIDAQIIGRKVYRYSSSSETFQLVQQITDLVTTTLADNGLTATTALNTQTNAPIPRFSRDIAVSPGGVMTLVQNDGDIAYFSLASAGLYDASKVIKPPFSPMASIYGLGRFIFPCTRGAFAVSIEDVTGIPIISMIDADEISAVSYNVYCVDIGNQIWWNTNKGIMATDGLSITPITRFQFSSDRNIALYKCYGALYFNGDVYIYANKDPYGQEATIYVFNKNTGWSEAEVITATSGAEGRFGTIGSYLGSLYSSILYTRDPLAPSADTWIFQGSNTKKAFWTYKTGQWVGEKISQLKKFRKTAFTHTGSFIFTIKIDGTSVLVRFVTGGASTQRSSFWLPPESKGRAISVEITGYTDAAIEEISLWVGEQRGPMP